MSNLPIYTVKETPCVKCNHINRTIVEYNLRKWTCVFCGEINCEHELMDTIRDKIIEKSDIAVDKMGNVYVVPAKLTKEEAIQYFPEKYNPCRGSTLEEFLNEEGILNECTIAAKERLKMQCTDKKTNKEQTRK